jgi:poly(hydroxyalkanoate) depolymerase family esterase
VSSIVHGEVDASASPGALHGEDEFRAGRFSHAAGERAYRLFVPRGAAAAGARPLLVMLHGCKQDAADFAAGTRMNELAQAHGWVVLYPEQARSANGLGCWNWFKAGHQQRGRGEPAILAGLVRHVVATEDIDPRRIYVAGLSAGGAMAATLAGTYPELFAAVGIHSGLPYAAANDVMSAFRAMRAGPRAAPAVRPEATAGPPTIVFHGDLDDTVHPDNGEALVAGARTAAAQPRAGPMRSWTRVERGRAPGGHAFTRTIHTSADGRIQAEHWLVHGAGHAWFGGSPRGSYTDPRGPDASAEMLRFFATHCRQAEAASAA